MWPFIVIKIKVVMQSCVQQWHGRIALEIKVFIFHGSPESFHENVVQSTAFSIHANANTGRKQDGCKGISRKLRPLIGVENFWATSRECLFECVNAKVRVERI